MSRRSKVESATVTPACLQAGDRGLGLGLGLGDLDLDFKIGFGLLDEEEEPQGAVLSSIDTTNRYLARESLANRSLWPIVWPLQIEIDLHDLPTAVSDRDRQNPRSKTLLLRLPPTVAVLQCCIATAFCVVKACEMDGTCRGSPDSRWSRVTARFRSCLGPDHASNTRYAVESGAAMLLLFPSTVSIPSPVACKILHCMGGRRALSDLASLKQTRRHAGHTADRQ